MTLWDGEPETDSVAIYSFNFKFLTLPFMRNVSLFGADRAFVTSGWVLSPCHHYLSLPPNKFIHHFGIMEEAQMYGSAAPKCLLYLANMYFF